MLRFTSRSAWIHVLMMAFSISAVRAELRQADVIIYGGTSSGIAAAVQVTRMGKTVIVAEPSHHLGVITTCGL
jgi:ribulose 1,5-bisphosphate synthetase/thiazole synthase